MGFLLQRGLGEGARCVGHEKGKGSLCLGCVGAQGRHQEGKILLNWGDSGLFPTYRWKFSSWPNARCWRMPLNCSPRCCFPENQLVFTWKWLCRFLSVMVFVAQKGSAAATRRKSWGLGQPRSCWWWSKPWKTFCSWLVLVIPNRSGDGVSDGLQGWGSSQLSCVQFVFSGQSSCPFFT